MKSTRGIKQVNTPFEAGKKAALDGKLINTNPYIIGVTKLGNPKMTEEGYDWENGFRSTTNRVATKEEIAAAASVDVSRFRKKSNRYYR